MECQSLAVDVKVNVLVSRSSPHSHHFFVEPEQLLLRVMSYYLIKGWSDPSETDPSVHVTKH